MGHRAADVTYQGDTNLGDPIVAPFVTKTAQTLTVKGLRAVRQGQRPRRSPTAQLWGNVYGKLRTAACAAAPPRWMSRRHQRPLPRRPARNRPSRRQAQQAFGSTQALRGVDVALQPGRCLGLVGRNGAGKSTLVSILSGSTRADAGQVRFDGEPAPPLAELGRVAPPHRHRLPALDGRPRSDRCRERLPRRQPGRRPGRLARDARAGPASWPTGASVSTWTGRAPA